MSDLRSVEVVSFGVVCRFNVGLSNSDVGSSVEFSAVLLSVIGEVAFWVTCEGSVLAVVCPADVVGWAVVATPMRRDSVANFYPHQSTSDVFKWFDLWIIRGPTIILTQSHAKHYYAPWATGKAKLLQVHLIPDTASFLRAKSEPEVKINFFFYARFYCITIIKLLGALSYSYTLTQFRRS